MTIPKQLRELMDFNADSKIEVRMPMTLNETLYKEFPYYSIRNVKEGFFQTLSTIWPQKKGPLYVIKRFFDFPGERASVLGFAFTRSGADRFAYERTLSLANRIAQYNGLSLEDLSKRDKEDLERTLLELKQEFGGTQ